MCDNNCVLKMNTVIESNYNNYRNVITWDFNLIKTLDCNPLGRKLVRYFVIIPFRSRSNTIP